MGRKKKGGDDFLDLPDPNEPVEDAEAGEVATMVR